MLYFDPLTEYPSIDEFELGIGSTSSHSGHFALIPSLKSLQRVCQLMISMFREQNGLSELQSHFERQKQAGGGVCDMYVFGIYHGTAS